MKIYGEHSILPDSYIISGSKLRKLGNSLIPSGGSSEVWAGIYEEDIPVAIKAMRFHNLGDHRKAKKVRFFGLFSSRLNLTFCRTFAERL